MNLSIVATLDSRYVKKDGSCAILVRIGRDNKTLPLSTKFSVPAKYWDEKRRKVRGSYPGVNSVTRLNNQIDDEVKFVRSIALELHDNGALESMSLNEIKARIVGEKKGGSFFTFGDKVLADLEKAGRIGTRNAYRDALKALENYHGSRSISFKEITFSFLKGFETDHFSKGNGKNGLAAYLRGIRAIYNLGIKSGQVAEKYYPFKSYKIGTEPTQKRAIEKDYLNEIFSLTLTSSHPCFHARNYFVISYMLCGMNFYDIALLTSNHIINDRVQYQRNKTSKPYDIKITPALKELLHFYVQPDNKYIFNIVKRHTPDLIDKDIKWARKRYNKKLKEIAELCGIKTNLTSYVSRHSFATQARLLSVPVDVISTMLGHSSIKTTQVYLASLPSNILDDYNDKIMQGL